MGIWADRFTYSHAADWVSLGNVVPGGTWVEPVSAEVLFGGDTTEEYGVTRRSVVSGITTALNPGLGAALQRYAAYGVFVEDNVTDLTIRDFNPGDNTYTGGKIRLPSNFHGFVEEVDNGRRNLIAGLERDPAFPTVARPSASDAGVGARYFDTTLNRVLSSDGTNWRTPAGGIG